MWCMIGICTLIGWYAASPSRAHAVARRLGPIHALAAILGAVLLWPATMVALLYTAVRA